MKKYLIIIPFLVSCASHTGTQVVVDSKSSASGKIKVAITVDDLPTQGPIPSNTNQLEIARKMLEVFKKHSVPEVYGFINAQKTDEKPKLNEVLKLWTDAGYPLGNHTYAHKKLNDISIEEFVKDIDQNEKTLSAEGSKFDWKYFRYPYLCEGETQEKRNAVREYLNSKGYKIAEVTVDFKDWAWSEPYARCLKSSNQEEIKWLKESYLKNAINQYRQQQKIALAIYNRPISHILLMHIGAFSAEMLDQLLSAYEKEGIEFVTLSEALKDKVYAEDHKVASTWGAIFTYQVMKSRGLSLKKLGIELQEDYPKLDLSLACQN